MTKVVLVDDHAGTREGLALLLPRKGVAVVGLAASAEEAGAVIERGMPDVAVIDLMTPDAQGVELAARLASRFPALATVLYTGRPRGPWLYDALRSGAHGVVLKSGSTSELVVAIERAAAGQTYIDPRLGGALSGSRSGERRDSVLSPREREVLERIATGMTADEIAAEFVLSVETVRTHTRNAIRKLRARNRLHAVVIALARGEIRSPVRPEDLF